MTYEQKCQEAIQKANAHNDSVKRFYEVDLVNHFGKDTINGGEWFIAMQLIEQQKFFQKACPIVDELRACGFQVKINYRRDTIEIEEERT